MHLLNKRQENHLFFAMVISAVHTIRQMTYPSLAGSQLVGRMVFFKLCCVMYSISVM